MKRDLIMIEKSIRQEAIRILRVYASNNIVTKCISKVGPAYLWSQRELIHCICLACLALPVPKCLAHIRHTVNDLKSQYYKPGCLILLIPTPAEILQANYQCLKHTQHTQTKTQLPNQYRMVLTGMTGFGLRNTQVHIPAPSLPGQATLGVITSMSLYSLICKLRNNNTSLQVFSSMKQNNI